jgi:hypothetical protein
MRILLLTLVLTTAIIAGDSCKKERGKENSLYSKLITGSWELRLAQTGRAPAIQYAPGNGNIFKFSGSAYEKYINGTLSTRGDYTILPDTSVRTEVGLSFPAGQFTNRIILDNELVSSKTFLNISNDTLTFVYGYFPVDGGSMFIYKRAGN